MWELEGFDRKSGGLVREHPLRELDQFAIRRVLNVDDDIPIEPFDFDVPNVDLVYEFAKYSDVPIVVDESLRYILAFYAD